ncbi:hypothetical protein A4D02_26290 [Niastella koreensis]|uniref:Uncharacterized protein n=1 Tax=Niastella koreensis TaxID=354356 RepID=A0ABX3P1V4_9BACT|nr:hypothetical protein A4D02_26290 [Niastella koreensis]
MEALYFFICAICDEGDWQKLFAERIKQITPRHIFKAYFIIPKHIKFPALIQVLLFSPHEQK